MRPDPAWKHSKDAVLVDALLSVGQARELADWVDAHGKNLASVYITHGHGDHWFGLSVILNCLGGFQI